MLSAAAVAVVGLIAFLLFGRDTSEKSPAEPARPAPSAPKPPAPRRAEAPAAVPPEPNQPPPAVELPAPAALTVRGRVTDASGVPLEKADVAVVGGDDREIARAVTDRNGAFEFPDAKASAVSVVARAAGHQTRAVVLVRSGPGAPAAPVDIALDKAAAIVGRVRLASGGVPGVPVRVMVRTPLELPPVRWSARECAGAALVDDLRIHTATTDESGAFRIDGLPPGLWCTLLAAGPGLATAMRNGIDLNEAQAGGATVEILVSPLYVFDVRICGPDGSAPPTSRLLGGFRGYPPFVTWTGPYPLSTIYANGAPTLRWTGMPVGDPDDPFHLIVAKAIDTDADRVGPYRLTVRIPGYEGTTADVWAVRAAPGRDVSQEIRLGAPITEFGTVRLRIDDHGTGFVAALAESAETQTSFRPAVLALKPDPSRRTVALGVGTVAVPLDRVARGVAEFAGVPVGDYLGRVEIEGAPRSVTDRSYDVRIDAGEVREVSVDIGEWSALRLELEVAGSPSTPYRGTVDVRLQPAGKPYWLSWRFSRPPYLLVGIAPGTYDVWISNPSFTEERFTVVLSRDAVARVARTVTAYRGPWRDIK